MSSLTKTPGEMLARLNDPRNGARRFNQVTEIVHNPMHAGRGAEVPQELREVAAELSLVMTQKQAGELTGLTQPSVQNYAQGRTGPTAEPTFKDSINAKRDKVNDLAMNLLLESIGLIDNKDIIPLKVREKAALAKDLAHVIEKTGSHLNEHSGQGIVLNIYTPNTKREAEFETITVIPQLQR